MGMSVPARTTRQNGIPLYVQLATTLRRRIETGQWPAGAKISTLEELQEEFQVARVTVRQAVDLIQKEGLVRRQQGKGTFVLEGLEDRRWLKLAMDWNALVDTIKDNTLKVIEHNKDADPPRLQDGQGKAAPAYIFQRSVQSRRDQPHSIVNLHLAKSLYESDPKSFRSRSALGMIAAMRIKVRGAHQTLVIGTADTQTAQLLALPLNAPVVETHCVVVDDDGVAIYVADVAYRGDVIKLDIDLLASSQ